MTAGETAKEDFYEERQNFDNRFDWSVDGGRVGANGL
jgi:hypothetical protein